MNTPRTDAFISKFYGNRSLSSGSRHRTDVELHDFARQLERELAAAMEQRDQFAVALERYYKQELRKCPFCGGSGTSDEYNLSVKPQGWIRVEDRLPFIRTRVMVCDSQNGFVDFMYKDAGTPGWFDSNREQMSVTHWQPVPLSPAIDAAMKECGK